MGIEDFFMFVYIFFIFLYFSILKKVIDFEPVIRTSISKPFGKSSDKFSTQIVLQETYREG